jgi:cytochrome c oxidase subunit 1/cytochrome c oxidase subunit I+III
MNERLGKWSFWTMFVGLNLTFFPMHNAGLLGMPRRIYTFPGGLGWDAINLLETVGAFILASGILISVWNFFFSVRNGRRAGKNPWNADSLEWETSSPPQPYGTVHIPTVVSRHPLWDTHDEEEDPRDERVFDQGRLTLATSWLDGEPDALSRTPKDTTTPLQLSATLLVFFLALVFQSVAFAIAGLLASAIVMAVWMWPTEDRQAA